MEYDVKAFLRFALDHFDLKILSEQGDLFELEYGYTIEVEGQQLFKLLHQGEVVAPFAGVEELCAFIKMDRQQYEKN